MERYKRKFTIEVEYEIDASLETAKAFDPSCLLQKVRGVGRQFNPISSSTISSSNLEVDTTVPTVWLVCPCSTVGGCSIIEGYAEGRCRICDREMRLAFKWPSPALGLDFTQDRSNANWDSPDKMTYRNILRTRHAHGKLDRSRLCDRCGKLIELGSDPEKSDAIIVFSYTSENQDLYKILPYHHECHYRNSGVDMPFDESEYSLIEGK